MDLSESAKASRSEVGAVVDAASAGIRIVQSVARAVALLKVLAARGEPMVLSDLAKAIETSKPATYHLLRTLEIEGFVAKSAHAAYRLDWGLYELGSAVIRAIDLTQFTRPHLSRLAERTGEAVQLSILDGGSVLYLDQAHPTGSFAIVANVGRRSPLHANASGKILLAHQEPEVIAKLISCPLKANTPSTVCNPNELDAQLTKARRDGYATSWQEQSLGLCGVAVPIFDYTGKICAAMEVTGPAGRVNTQTAGRLVQRLKEEAHQVATKLGVPVSKPGV